MSPQAMHIESFFDPTTFTFSHILADLHSKKCVLIDSVLDYDPKSGRTSTANANRLIARVKELGLSVQWLLETHVHANHISAAPYLQKHVGVRESQCITTVGEQKRANIHVHHGVNQVEFVSMREKRDAMLSVPVLILPSVQVNMRGGQFLPPEDNGQRYLKIPVDAL